MSFKSVIAALAVVVGGVALADPLDSQSTVEPGKWCNNFEAALAYAEANNIPLLVFRAGATCGQCKKLEAACLESDFVAWQAERKLVMAFEYGSRSAAYESWMKSANTQKLSSLPIMAVYWKSNASGQTVLSVFTGRNGKMPSKDGSLGQQLMDSVDLLTAGWSPSGVTPTPTPTPTPTVDVRSEAYGARQKLSALVMDKDTGTTCGTATISIGAFSTKKETVKVSVKATLFAGKTYSASQTLSVAKDGSAAGSLTFKSPLGGMASVLVYDTTAKKCTFAALGSYAIETIDGTIGGVLSSSAMTFSSEVAAVAPAGYAFVTSPNVNESVYVKNGKTFKFDKAATLKYKKVDGVYVLQGLDNAARPNTSSLKLTYKYSTGQFSGSYKVYASNAASVGSAKPKLAKYTATVKGAVVNGVGYGVVSVNVGGTSYIGSCVIK